MTAEPPRGPRPSSPRPPVPDGSPVAEDPLLLADSGRVTGTGQEAAGKRPVGRRGWRGAVASGALAVLLGASAAWVVDAAEPDPEGTTTTLASGERQEQVGYSPLRGGAAPAGHGPGTLRIGVRFDQPGLGLLERDAPTGFDIDVALYVASHLGYTADEIEWVEVLPGNREALLQQLEVDMVVADYGITDARDAVVDFAGPYYVARHDLLVAAEDTGTESLADLEDGVLCSAPGSHSADTALAEAGVDARLREVDSNADCLQLLELDLVDAVIGEDLALAGLAATAPGDYRLVGDPLGEVAYGVGLPTNTHESCRTVNRAIAQMWADGATHRFLEDAFGGMDLDPPELAPRRKNCL